MPSWAPLVAYLAGTLAMFALRGPHIRQSAKVPVVESRIGIREKLLVTLVGVGLLLLPLVWIATDLLAWADRPGGAWDLTAGLVAYALGLWLLKRSHVDLGRQWSNTLQIRADHRLVTEGVYRRARHPMYSALLLHGLGQALVIPNGVAGPAFLVAFALLVALRMRPEERMLAERFGAEWQTYRARTTRLVPGLF